MRQIFIDMDGVVADLDGFYFNLTGLPSPKSGGPEGKSFWRVVNKYTKDLPATASTKTYQSYPTPIS
jgi:hypothetical protein